MLLVQRQDVGVVVEVVISSFVFTDGETKEQLRILGDSDRQLFLNVLVEFGLLLLVLRQHQHVVDDGA